MSWRPHGRATVAVPPRGAWGVCDRCGFLYDLNRLDFQFDYRGLKLQNLNLRVCERCYDKPSPFYRPILLPPDPVPVLNPRPENYAAAENNYLSTEGGDHMTTEDDDPLVQEGGGNNV